MKCPICNKELKIMRETIVDETTVEVIGACESGEYDDCGSRKKMNTEM